MKLYRFFKFYLGIGFPVKRALRRAWEMSR
jgi:hypothetical protein